MRKVGLEYFPVPVSFSMYFKVLQSKYGVCVYAIYLKLMQAIFSDAGYFVECDEDFYILLSDDIKQECSVVKKVVLAFVDRGLFNKDLFTKFNVLTSDDIQKDFINAAKKRKVVYMKKEYCLEYAQTFFKIKKNNQKVSNYDIVKQEHVEQVIEKKLSNSFDRDDDFALCANDVGIVQNCSRGNQVKTTNKDEDFNKEEKSIEDERRRDDSIGESRLGVCVNVRDREVSEKSKIDNNENNDRKKREENYEIFAGDINKKNYEQTRVVNGVKERVYSKEQIKNFFTNIDDIIL